MRLRSRASRALGITASLLMLAAAGRAGTHIAPAVAACAPNPMTHVCGGGSTTAGPFAKPQDLGPLFELNFPGGLTTTPNYRSTVASGTDGSQVLSVENPAVTMGFTIHPGSGPRNPNGEPYTWKYTLTAEVCLYSNEVAAWPNAQDTGDDCAKDRPLTTSVSPPDWYKVGQVSQSDLILANGGPPGTTTFGSSLNLNLQAVATTFRVHADAQLTSNGRVAPVNADSVTLHIVVLPAALVQEKVLPSTILYNPLGNNGSASLALASSYNVVTTTGSSTENDRSNAQDEWLKIEADLGGAFNTDIFATAFKLTGDTRWDHTVTLFNGQATVDTTATSQSCTTTFTDGIGQNDRNTEPGSAGPYQFEPFWGDKVEVMVHPQFALWDFYGTTTMQLLGVDGICGVPPLHGISVFDLNLCANPTMANPGGGPNQFAKGITITVDEGHGQSVAETLNANDCAGLAALDPFYASAQGQAADLSGRGSFLLEDSFGVPGPGQADSPLTISEAWTQTQTNTHEVDQTYKTDVQDIHATEGSAGLNLTQVFGFDISVTASAGITTTSDLTSITTYKNSTAQTTSQTTTVTGTVDDKTYRGYEPQVEFWQDDIFGTPMYRDPQARSRPATH